MSQTAKQLIGQKGEDLSCDFLKRQGYQIVDRNYWRKWGEIDIVAQRGNDLRFVEVKTVVRDKLILAEQAHNHGDDYEPEDNLHPWKLKRLRRVIETYLMHKDIDDEIDWQVDAICIYLDRSGELLKIEVLEDIVL